MILLLIVLLWLLSLSLRIVYSGVNTLMKVNKRVVNVSANLVQKSSDLATKGSNTNVLKDRKVFKKMGNVASKSSDMVGKLSKIAIKTLRRIVDLVRYLLESILPLVLVVDIIVLVTMVTLASTVSFLFNNGIIQNNLMSNVAGSVDTGGTESSQSQGGVSDFNPSGNSLGERAISIAKNCVDTGVPLYVSGGISLETGADCSGFILAIYTKLNYPHIDIMGEYRVHYMDMPSEVGEYKSLSGMSDDEKAEWLAKANPGDIYHFPGHVGLSDGNSGMIHIFTEGVPAEFLDKDSFREREFSSLDGIFYLK